MTDHPESGPRKMGDSKVTISFIELARLTSDWRSLYDVCCKMNSALERAESRIAEQDGLLAAWREEKRTIDGLQAQCEAAERRHKELSSSPSDFQIIEDLQDKLAQAEKERDALVGMRNDSVISARLERDDALTRYRSVELANAEMTRSDHVTFGELLGLRNFLRAENERLREKILSTSEHGQRYLAEVAEEIARGRER